MTNYQSELHDLTQVLLQPADDYAELTRTIDGLNRLLLEVSGLREDLGTNREPLYLPWGKAIGPVWAGMCVREIMRTKRFLRGVYRGVQWALQKFAARPIRVLYAGTGPFATLALPLTTVFSSAEISFTMLEIHPESIKCLERAITAFHAEKFVTEIVRGDATKYQADKEKPFQMIVTETMQNALQKEPQVAITLNLAPQITGGGILIPENIEVEAILLHPQKNNRRMLHGFVEKYYFSLGKIFELNKDTPRDHAYSPGFISEPYFFPEVELEIPTGIDPGYSQLCLFTGIRVFSTEQLLPWQCSLTMPQRIVTINQAEKPVARICFKYKIDQEPGFQYYLK